LQSGEGGQDSKNFVDELFCAYLKYAKSLNLKSELLSKSEGHIIVKFCGKKAGMAFKHESGKHCCQRVPVTESKGRRHTSIISVAVLPIKSHDDKPLIDTDLTVTTQGGHGPGGQHQNATDSAVRMIHKPTRLSVFINGKSQHANKREARKILTARVNSFYHQQQDDAYNSHRKKQMNGGGRGDKVRTYNFISGIVKDHNLRTKTGNIEGVMRGKFQLILV